MLGARDGAQGVRRGTRTSLLVGVVTRGGGTGRGGRREGG